MKELITSLEALYMDISKRVVQSKLVLYYKILWSQRSSYPGYRQANGSLCNLPNDTKRRNSKGTELPDSCWLQWMHRNSTNGNGK